MNRKNLTSAVLAGLAGAAGIAATAQAVNINPDGLGQLLIYPYYTTNGGNDTLLSVVNTTDNAKAVKVRFSEGQNTREVLDFNLYMSAFDVWTAAIFDDAGTPTLRTMDTTCTVPYIYGDLGGEQAFLVFAMNDGGGWLIDRATEGHFEMIEMGTLTGDSAIKATHVDGVPPDSKLFEDSVSRPCGQLVDAWTDPDDLVDDDEGYWFDDPTVDIEAPSGGLFGGAAIIDVDEGYMVSYDAKAINGWAESGFNPLLHQQPGSSLPSINSGDQFDGTVFLDNGTILNSGDLARSVDALSFVFMHDQIMNEYITGSGIGAQTEWVVSFPTKAFYVYEDVSGSSNPIAPFTSMWVGTHNEDSPETPDPELELPCEVVGLSGIWDREERAPFTPDPEGDPIPPIVSPAPPEPPEEIPDFLPFELCYEVSVIRFGSVDDFDALTDGTEIFGSTNTHNIDNEILGFESGWVRLEMDDYVDDLNPVDGVPEAYSRDGLGGLEGLPVTGFSANRFGNAFLGDGADVLANYGGIFQHKATRKETPVSD